MQSIGVLLKNGGRRPPRATFSRFPFATILKSMPSDLIRGWELICEKIVLKQRDEIVIKF